MPLMELVPPSTFPRGEYIDRPASSGSASLSYIQFTAGSANSRENPIGRWIQGLRSGGPASNSSTRYRPDSLSRAATAHPAEPAPVTI